MIHIEKAIELINKNYKHVLEFGVYKGRSIQKLRYNLDSTYQIFGFDSFEGLPEDWKGTDLKKGFFNADGNVPDIDNVTFYKGWFDETIPSYLKIAKPIGILHIDCDLYSSTKSVLYSLNDYILKDTIIVFDEWFYNFNPNCNDHEQKCFYEWVKDFNREFTLINHSSELATNEQQIIKILK